MAKRRDCEQRYWTLVANPTEYRISEAILRLNRDWWTSGRSDIRFGDGIAIWKARGGKGAGRGVIALGYVVDGPILRADKGNPFHLNPRRAREVMNRVAVSYVPLSRPLWDDGEHGAMISTLNAARARRGTVFKLSPEQWRALEAATLDGENIADEGKLTKGASEDSIADSAAGSLEHTEIHPAQTLTVEAVPIEAHLTERSVVEPDREPYEAERREARLLSDFRDYMHSLGHEVQRLRILPEGEAKPLYTDLYVPDLNLLIEAKGTKERGAIRMALGQLIDYRRFIQWTRCAILVPSRPREDLRRLVLGAGFDLYWQDGDTFHHEPSSAERAGQTEGVVPRAA